MTFTSDLPPLTEIEMSSSSYTKGLGDLCSRER